jgi:hypothetical protein
LGKDWSLMMLTKKCFVAMPFDGSCDSAYYNAILPACAELSVKCERLDADLSEQSIVQQIVNGIYDADVVIADITGANPNVFYELGISHALPYPNKTIVIAKKGTKIPFDIHSFRIIQYDDEIKEGLRLLASQLRERMAKLIAGSDDTSNPVQDNIQYYEGLVLTQEDAAERHGLTLHEALQSCRYSLILIGTTLFSVRNQLARLKIKEKVERPEFRELSLVMRDVGATDVSINITRHLNEFISDEGIIELLKLNSSNRKFFLFFCKDFLRFSATYIDHLEEYGRIRVTHSIYGSLMEQAPSYLLTRKRGLKLYENYVKAWEDLKARKGTTRIDSVADFEAYRDKFK